MVYDVIDDLGGKTVLDMETTNGLVLNQLLCKQDQ